MVVLVVLDPDKEFVFELFLVFLEYLVGVCLLVAVEHLSLSWVAQALSRVVDAWHLNTLVDALHLSFQIVVAFSGFTVLVELLDELVKDHV